MNACINNVRLPLTAALAATVFVLAGCAGMDMGDRLTLTGANEVPPVTTIAAGSGRISVASDKAVSGSVSVEGMTATAAHIHTGAPGKNGPVIVPLTKTSENTWSVPAGSKLTDAQYDSYRAGNLYVNVHSAKNPGGEIRAQLRP